MALLNLMAFGSGRKIWDGYGVIPSSGLLFGTINTLVGIISPELSMVIRFFGITDYPNTKFGELSFSVEAI